MDKFTKWFEWTKKNKDLTQNGMLLICVLTEKWEYHNHQPFHYSLKWLAEQIKVNKQHTVIEGLNNLVDLNLIEISKRTENGVRKNYYTINQETLDKLSGEADTSKPMVTKQKSPQEIFNEWLVKLFEKNKQLLLAPNNLGSARTKLLNGLQKPEYIKVFGDINEFNKNFSKQYNEWYQKQKDSKSQVI